MESNRNKIGKILVNIFGLLGAFLYIKILCFYITLMFTSNTIYINSSNMSDEDYAKLFKNPANDPNYFLIYYGIDIVVFSIMVIILLVLIFLPKDEDEKDEKVEKVK